MSALLPLTEKIEILIIILTQETGGLKALKVEKSET
jgi:hypothetical protein